jgi:hypothetical protein
VPVREIAFCAPTTSEITWDAECAVKPELVVEGVEDEPPPTCDGHEIRVCGKTFDVSANASVHTCVRERQRRVHGPVVIEDDGRTYVTGDCFEGTAEGIWRWWNADGSLAREAVYHLGLPTGQRHSWPARSNE